MILLQIIGDWEPSQQVTMGLFPDQDNIGKLNLSIACQSFLQALITFRSPGARFIRNLLTTLNNTPEFPQLPLTNKIHI